MEYKIVNNIDDLITEDLIYNYDKRPNYFDRKPSGILIYDSYNNPFFPYPEIILDKNTFDLPKYKHFLNKVFGTELSQLPFHFYIELVNDEYLIFNTRNFMMKPLIPDNVELKSDELNKAKNMIHICILGDSDSDVYTRDIYEKIKNIIKPFSIVFKWGSYVKNYVDIWMGKQFFSDKIIKF